ncbi:hypothetical protein Tsubulata_001754 [Turnera subulata]|uniref:Thioredoxin-like 4, chloroplastic n=1 Tax=Turnera subulata TaxID=218843 RepID=A0A9Q0JGB0_9ROSI|nr:hypothetical protein Tsubulata_001754 [Turnera subulata]
MKGRKGEKEEWMDVEHRVISSFEVVKPQRIWQNRKFSLPHLSQNELRFSDCGIFFERSVALHLTAVLIGERVVVFFLYASHFEQASHRFCYFGRFPYVVMLKQNIVYSKASFGFGVSADEQNDSRAHCIVPSGSHSRIEDKSCSMRAKIPLVNGISSLDLVKNSDMLRCGKIKGVADGNAAELSEEDDDLCPVDCVREFKTDEEFFRILEKAKETNSLVVVDFYRTSCGSCKYIEQGFAKLCRGSGDQEAPVIFLKHNVIDEYDEQSEVADRLRIKTVPLFHFYKDGALLEAFPTRDKEKITAAILKYTSAELKIQDT